MLALPFFALLACFLWGSFIGASFRRGHPLIKVHLPKGAAIVGNLLFTLPLIPLLFFTPVSSTQAILAVLLASIAFVVGLIVGVKVYWID